METQTAKEMVWKISSIYSCVGKPCSHQNIFPRYLNKRMGMLKNRETWTRHSVKSERSTHTLKLISYMEFLPGVQLKPEERVKRLIALRDNDRTDSTGPWWVTRERGKMQPFVITVKHK